jgi:hypothetical protein
MNRHSYGLLHDAVSSSDYIGMVGLINNELEIM